jgi:hypothetical protein
MNDYVTPRERLAPHPKVAERRIDTAVAAIIIAIGIAFLAAGAVERAVEVYEACQAAEVRR